MNTAQTAIVASAVVGLGAPALSALFQWVREKGAADRERLSKDLDELRGLLDELTAVMYEHTTQLVALERWMQHSTFGLPKPEKAPATEPTRRSLYTLNARLVIRRGRDDQLVKALGRYLKAVDEGVEQVGQLWSDNEPFDYSDEDLDERAAGYRHLYETFVDESKGIVGSKLI